MPESVTAATAACQERDLAHDSTAGIRHNADDWLNLTRPEKTLYLDKLGRHY